MGERGLKRKSINKRVVALGATLALASLGLASAHASTTFDVDGLDLDFNKGAAAVVSTNFVVNARVATTTNIVLSGDQEIDGYLTSVLTAFYGPEPILVKDQTNPSENGLYTANSGAWTRIAEYDDASEINAGDFVSVSSNGTTNGDSSWTQQNAVTTLGTHPIVWAQTTDVQADTRKGVHFGTSMSPLNSVNYYDIATISGVGIDARITYLEHYGVNSGGAGVLDKLDDATSGVGENRFVRTEVDWDSNENAQDRYAEFKVEFFKDLHTTPVAVNLQNLKLSIYDVDNFQTVSLTGADDYLLAAETILAVRRVPGTETLNVTSLDEPSTGSNVGGAGVVSSFAQGRVSFSFDEVSTFTYTLGLPASDTGSNSSFDLDFGDGAPWGSRPEDAIQTRALSDAPVQGETEQTPDPEPTPDVAPAPYSGPIPVTLSPGVISTNTSTEATLAGERLSSITKATVDGKEVVIKTSAAKELSLTLPPLDPGTYSIIYYSGSGQITHQDSLVVRKTAGPTDAVTEPGEEVDAGSEASPFFAAKRFTNYLGDRAGVVDKDELAIKRFFSGYRGVTRITCVGSTSGVPAMETDLALATNRANNACDIARKLYPEATVNIRTSTGKGIGQFYRSVSVFIAGNN
jgi:hypothetical protein